MKIPYIRIQQRNETFYVVKFKAKELKQHVSFHFRDPYEKDKDNAILYDKYISKLQEKGIGISREEQGIQRRLQLSRIQQIKKFLEEKEDSYLPTAVVLSADITEQEVFLQEYDTIESSESGVMELSDDITFQIVDGQHRLAGLFISEDSVVDSFDVCAVLLFNLTSNTCAQLFGDINGNQVKVNRSVIYDLYDLRNADNENEQKIQNLHVMCNKFNTDPESPLYRHIKMLGIGEGSISQAFFVESTKEATTSMDILTDLQAIYDNFFFYLKSFQNTFKPFWPVLELGEYSSIADFQAYSRCILTENKSQLLKTNGFGAIMDLFPKIYKMLEEHSYENYQEIVDRLKDEIDWVNDPLLKAGTGRKVQKEMSRKMLSIIEGKAPQ